VKTKDKEGNQMRIKKYDELEVRIADTVAELGRDAAEKFAEAVKSELATKEEIGSIIALGAAQEAFFAALKARDDIEWSRINLLQIDVYVGVPDSDPRSGGSRLRDNLVNEVKPKSFWPMTGDTEPVDAELQRYTELFQKYQPSVCVYGVGDTGHLGFIDPPADFGTASDVVCVALSHVTRNQIAKYGIFGGIDQVPLYGISFSIPALLKPKHVITLVHEADKADTMKKILEEPVTIMCPASILKTKPGALLYLSAEAASTLSLN
jgi:glucosamine-6-phosphate deaminase